MKMKKYRRNECSIKDNTDDGTELACYGFVCQKPQLPNDSFKAVRAAGRSSCRPGSRLHGIAHDRILRLLQAA